MPRIVSFLPAGTEIIHALGAVDQLVGRSHECDYPRSVVNLPVVSRPALKLDNASPEEIDRAVVEQMQTGASMYEIDEVLLEELTPDVIVTQNLCRVCAPSGNELSRAVRRFEVVPQILFLTPRNLAEIDQNIIDVGKAIGREAHANDIIESNRERISRVRRAVANVTPRRVVFLEWTDPPFCGGHWVPEMIAAAGGHDPLGRPGEDSVRISWSDVEAAQPEMVIVSPCGYGLDQSIELAKTIPIETNAKVVAVDANAYFARPGPRYAEAIELLAALFHPDHFNSAALIASQVIERSHHRDPSFQS